jgi:signal transduction histidine kinase
MGALARDDRQFPTARVMTVLWICFTVGYLAFFYVFQGAREIADSGVDAYLEVTLLGIPCLILLAAILWLFESEADEDLRPPLVAWTLGMSLMFTVAMYAALFAIETRFDPGEQWFILLLSTGVGASAGAVTGILGIRSKQSERARSASQRLANRRERERRQLEHLNQYLRHEVLNEVNKIHGYSELLSDRTDDPDLEEYLTIIGNSSEDISLFIGSIREVLDATGHNPEIEIVDVVSVIRTELRKLDAVDPDTEMTLEAPDSAHVIGGDLLERVFINLVENAIEHGPAGTEIDISVTRADEWVYVRVSDDGPGIPEDVRGELFTPPRRGDHGYGLFLTKNLVELYGGRIALESTGPEGSTFLVRLQQAGHEQTVVDTPIELGTSPS